LRFAPIPDEPAGSDRPRSGNWGDAHHLDHGALIGGALPVGFGRAASCKREPEEDKGK
jgi:hypothetical protein